MRVAHPGRRVIVFTAFDSDERIVEALRAGAQGFAQRVFRVRNSLTPFVWCMAVNRYYNPS